MAGGAVPVKMFLRDPDSQDQAKPQAGWCLLGMHVYVMRRSDESSNVVVGDVESPETPRLVDFLPTKAENIGSFYIKCLKAALWVLFVLVQALFCLRVVPAVDHFCNYKLKRCWSTWRPLENYFPPPASFPYLFLLFQAS